MSNRIRVVFASLLAVLVISLLLWQRGRRTPQPNGTSTATEKVAEQVALPPQKPDRSATHIRAHNLLLRKGPEFRVYVRWLAGNLTRTRGNIIPSFDNSDSFALDIQAGVIRANIGDIGHYLNSAMVDSPLKNVNLVADGPNLKLTGTLHKVVPLPVQVIASVSATPDGQVRVHVTKIDVLKIPMRKLLGLIHLSAADLIKKKMDGLTVDGNDLVLDTLKLLPPPHIRGHLTQVSVDSPDIQATFGNAAQDVERVELWRNFFALQGGAIDFGNLTMHPVDITIIDISSNPWFDLDLVNYREQFGSGYTRMTTDSALQIFIPDRRDVASKPAASDQSIQWFKDRNIPPPKQIVASAGH